MELQRYINQMKAEYLSELAQHLVCFEIKPRIPTCLKQALIANFQVQAVVGSLLAPSIDSGNYSICDCIDFVITPNATKILVDTNLNLAARVLEEASLAH